MKTRWIWMAWVLVVLVAVPGSSLAVWKTQVVAPGHFIEVYDNDRALARKSDGTLVAVYGGAALYVATKAPAAASWTVQIADPAGPTGSHAEVAIGPGDVVHVVYDHNATKRIKHAWLDGTTWRIEEVNPAQEGHNGTLAVDSQGRPHIAYHTPMGFVLRYAYWNGASFAIETVDSSGNTGHDPIIDLTSKDIPTIVYRDRTTGNLRYAYKTFNGWSLQTIANMGPEDALAGYANTFLLDSKDRPHAAFFDTTGRDLKYATLSTGVGAAPGWVVTTIESAGDVGETISIALDPQDRPALAYTDGTASDLKIARRTDQGWAVSVAPGYFHPGYAPSLVVDAAGQCHLTYFHFAEKRMKQRVFDGSSWTEEIFDTSVSVGKHNSIAVDGSGRPHLSFCDEELGTLYYGTTRQGTWVTETVDTADAGFYSAIALDSGGRPHIVYRTRAPLAGLRYAFHDGTQWIRKSLDGLGGPVALALDESDQPQIAHQTFTGSRLKFTHRAGASWLSETVDPTREVRLDRISIALDRSNHPHIVYRDDTASNLRYAFFDGAAWQLEPIDSTFYVGWSSTIVVDSTGVPHVGYFSPNTGKVRYAVRTASGWQIESLEILNDMGLAPVLRLDTADHPHLVFHRNQTHELVLARKLGAAWEYVTLDPSISPENFLSMALDALSVPHVAHYDSATHGLKYTTDIAPTLEVFPGRYDFGVVALNSAAGPAAFILQNTGDQALQVMAIALTDGTHYALDPAAGPWPCGPLPRTLAPLESCTVTVSFSPRAAGELPVSLRIQSSDLALPSLDLPLTGSGQTGCPEPAAVDSKPPGRGGGGCASAEPSARTDVSLLALLVFLTLFIPPRRRGPA